MRDEAKSLDALFARLVPVLEATGHTFEVVCVNDGSGDDTLSVLDTWRQRDARIRVIDLSRNFGKEAALTCGVDHALGDAVIPLDADLQDPPELIPNMLKLWQAGFDVVLPQRVDRSTDTWMKRKSAGWFYLLHNAISEAPLPVNVGDFRLLDRKVVDAVSGMRERKRFMKGLFAWVGFRQATIPYVREARHADTSRFSAWRLWNLALEGITSFSTAPLRIWLYIGAVIAMLSFAYAVFIVVRTLVIGVDIPGYASMIAVTLFLGGVQLVGLGVLGEYIGRIYLETKQRPVYVVRKRGDSAADVSDAT